MAESRSYEAPGLHVLGSFEELTQGTLVSGGPDVVLFVQVYVRR